MGHEVGHVEARHAAERMSQQVLVSLGVQAASLVLSEEFGEHADDIAGALGMGVMYGVVLPYSRKHELEADALGVSLMRKASYDPADAVGFWERMVANAASRPKPPEWLSTHPADGTRLEQLRTAAARG
jgi:predicted Zn-dependent protease